MKLMNIEFLISRLHAFIDLEKIPFNSTDRGKLFTVSEGIEREIYSVLINEENITTRLLIIESLVAIRIEGRNPAHIDGSIRTCMKIYGHVYRRCVYSTVKKM